MGDVFAGRYEFVEPVGHGGMGTVWIVWDIRDRTHRAAKLLRQPDAGSLIRFVREQSLRIDHDHVVTPCGWSAEDDRVLFTMNLVRGGSVHDLLGDFGALTASWTATLFDQLLLALEAVHGAGVVHRDLKPANLLLEPTGSKRPHLRLGDFGVAIALDEPRLTHATTVLGTPGYRAPEQMAGADPHPSQDLWAAGIVLAEMLSGQRPPSNVESVPPTPPDGVDGVLWKLACAMADPDPKRRPPSATEVRGVLATTGKVAPAGTAPDDEGAEIEVLEHITVPALASPTGAMGVEGGGAAESRGEPVEAPPRPRDSGGQDSGSSPERGALPGRSNVAALGWLAIVVGVLLVVVAGWLLVG